MHIVEPDEKKVWAEIPRSWLHIKLSIQTFLCENPGTD